MIRQIALQDPSLPTTFRPLSRAQYLRVSRAQVQRWYNAQVDDLLGIGQSTTNSTSADVATPPAMDRAIVSAAAAAESETVEDTRDLQRARLSPSKGTTEGK